MKLLPVSAKQVFDILCVKFKCTFSFSFRKVFAAFFASIYGNFAAPSADVMQQKIHKTLLPPFINEIDDKKIFEGEGVRDRFDTQKRAQSERTKDDDKEIQSRGDIKFNGADGSNAEVTFHEFKTLENGNYHFE